MLTKYRSRVGGGERSLLFLVLVLLLALLLVLLLVLLLAQRLLARRG